MSARLPVLPASTSSGDDGDFARAFADLMKRLHLELGGSQGAAGPVARAAFLAARAVSEGHACIDLRSWAGQEDSPDEGEGRTPAREEWLPMLGASPVVAAAGAQDMFRPLVLDAAGRLFLHRYWDYEGRVAEKLRALNTGLPVADAGEIRQLLDQYFPAGGGGPDWQKVAAATALTRRLAVISGGPGTGKTSTVVKILAILLAIEPRLRVALAAPTGKAAARMRESIRSQFASLQVPEEVRARMPETPFTVHRLLGYVPDSIHFRHNADNPLAWDLVVVDEASMLDLALAAKLLDALPPKGRLILLGDKDQLASVETGVVFAEVCAARGSTAAHRERIADLVGEKLPEAEASGQPSFNDAVVWLTRSYRFTEESGIGRLARGVNAGDAEGAVKVLTEGACAEVKWVRDLPNPGDLAERLIDGFAPFMDAVSRRASPEEILSKFDRYRVLCALREGEYGARHLSAEIGEIFRRRLGQGQADAGRWYAGRLVLVTRNDYALRVFNGDVGVALPDAAGDLLVHFPVTEGGTRSIAPSRLADCETAFAMTVHKAQGSEFDRADLVLPPHDSRVLTRELVYTALTRARSALTLWGPEEILRAAIDRPTARVSGLGDRLRG